MWWRCSAVAAEAAASAGDLDRAEAAARMITGLGRQARVLGGLAEAAAGAGDLDRAKALAERAEAAARAIADPDQQAQALADLAREVEPNHARSLLARALTVGRWKASVDVLLQINPAAVISIADEYLRLSAIRSEH